MNKTLLLVTAAMTVAAAAWTQPRIISFNSWGDLTWTNSAARGFYDVKHADSPTGPWNHFVTVDDLDWSPTNFITTRVPLTNGQAFYRVAWLPPDPIGLWDYRGFDWQGTLVITGQMTFVSVQLVTTNTPVVYRVQGSKDFHYAGPDTNGPPWWLLPQLETRWPYHPYLRGTVEMETSQLSWVSPTNCYDCAVEWIGIVGPNTHTGRWVYVTFLGPFSGPFSAVRMPSTNLVDNQP